MSGTYSVRRARLAAAVSRIALLITGLVVVESCQYVRLLRPSVLRQLNPRVVHLVDELPELDRPNKAIVGRLPGLGGLSRARVDRDGVMRAEVRVPKDQLIWEPAVVVAPRGGVLELTFQNADQRAHAVMVEDRRGEQLLELPPHAAGRMRLELEEPGLYKFTCPVADHGMRGMLGLIMVAGEVPSEARLDRPGQQRPHR